VEKNVKEGFWDRFLASRKGDFQTQGRKGTQPIGVAPAIQKLRVRANIRNSAKFLK